MVYVINLDDFTGFKNFKFIFSAHLSILYLTIVTMNLFIYLFLFILKHQFVLRSLNDFFRASKNHFYNLVLDATGSLLGTPKKNQSINDI